jgi:hypothetical protein
VGSHSSSDFDDVRDFLLYAKQEVIQQAMKSLGLFDHRQVAAAVDHVQFGVWQRGAENFAVLQRNNAIQASPDEQRFGTESLYLVRQLWIAAWTLHQVGHQPATLPLPLELRPPADVLPFGAETIGLCGGDQSQSTKYGLRKGLFI